MLHTFSSWFPKSEEEGKTIVESCFEPFVQNEEVEQIITHHRNGQLVLFQRKEPGGDDRENWKKCLPVKDSAPTGGEVVFWAYLGIILLTSESRSVSLSTHHDSVCLSPSGMWGCR